MSAIADELQKLAELRTAGSLTADEYLEAKAIVLSGRQTTRPAAHPPQTPPTQQGATNYGLATAAFILGLVALPFSWVGIVPITAVVASVCAMVGFDHDRHKNWWMAAAGLTLGLLGTLAMLAHYKYI